MAILSNSCAVRTFEDDETKADEEVIIEEPKKVDEEDSYRVIEHGRSAYVRLEPVLDTSQYVTNREHILHENSSDTLTRNFKSSQDGYEDFFFGIKTEKSATLDSLGSATLDMATNPRSSIVMDISYHGDISGKEAEKKLLEYSGHCHLTRYSKRKGCYVMSVQLIKGGSNVIKHFRIVDGEKMSIDTNEKKVEFDSFEHLLNHYRHHPLIQEADSTIGRPCQKQKKCCLLI